MQLRSAAPFITSDSENKCRLVWSFGCALGNRYRLFEFEAILEEAIARAAVGEYDGNELATDGSDCSMYMYGPDADALFAIVKPRLLSASFLRNVVVTLRYGYVTDPTAREHTVRLTP